MPANATLAPAQVSQTSKAPAPSRGVPSVEHELETIDRRVVAFTEELQPVGEVGRVLVRRAAVLSVRLDRCVVHESASLAGRVRRALAASRASEGTDAAEEARLRDETARLASFDPSPEAAMARKFEADTERGFLRVINELRQINRARRPLSDEAKAEVFRQELGSIFAGRDRDAEFDAMLDAIERKQGIGPARSRPIPAGGRVNVPIAIGRRR